MRPWIGPSYGGSGYRGRKVLVLGESEYEWKSGVLTSEIATTLITDNIRGDYSNPFYTKIYHVFSEEPKWKSFARFGEFWNSVAFYNYIQEKVGTTPRQRPTPEMWPRWQGTFLSVIETLAPDRILVLGLELWQNLQWLKIIERSPEKEGEFRLIAKTLTIKAAHIPHPASFGFKPDEWRAATGDLLL
jgi:hypothetical protein